MTWEAWQQRPLIWLLLRDGRELGMLSLLDDAAASPSQLVHDLVTQLNAAADLQPPDRRQADDLADLVWLARRRTEELPREHPARLEIVDRWQQIDDSSNVRHEIVQFCQFVDLTVDAAHRAADR